MTVDVAIIDVWDVETFDRELCSDLDAHSDVIRDYMHTSRRRWLKAPVFSICCSAPHYAGHLHNRRKRALTVDYSLLISVAYRFSRGNREANHLAIGFERRNDENRQPPKAEQSVPASGPGTDARAKWRWTRPASDRDGSPARQTRRKRGIRSRDEGTPHAAFLTLQERAS